MRSARTLSLHLALLLLASAVFAPSASAQNCAFATITSEVSTEPGFTGLYKYCVRVEWSLGRRELSHVDAFLELDNCECICDPRLIKFASPAGWQTGETEYGNNCVLDYYGEYACTGDSSIPDVINGPAVKFEPDPALDCPPGVTGSGNFCFYSPMPPTPPSEFLNGIAIKHGQEVCYGRVEGVLPTCNCALPVAPSTLGRIKATYR